MNTLPALPAMLTVPDAAFLLGIPASTLYEQVRQGRDGVGGRKAGKTSRVQTRAVCEACGITRDQAAAILAERDTTTPVDNITPSRNIAYRDDADPSTRGAA